MEVKNHLEDSEKQFVQCSGLLDDALRYIEALEEKLSSIQAERNSLLDELASVRMAVQEELKMIYCLGKNYEEPEWLRFEDFDDVWEEPAAEWELVLDLVAGYSYYRNKLDGRIAKEK